MNINSLKGKSSDEIAKIVHQGQVYGDGSDYYDGHIALVKEKAKEICQKYNISPSDTKKILWLADLHDAPEDTELKGRDIAILFDQELGDDCEALNKDDLHGNPKSKDTYYSDISLNIRRKIVKTADRVVNINKICDLKDDARALKLYNKYNNDYQYYLKYNIFPDLVLESLSNTKINLINKGLIKN